MKSNYYTITKDNLYTLIRSLSEESDVYIPVETNDHLHYEKFDPEAKEDYVIDQIRSSEPVKSFFTSSRERVDNASGTLEKERRQVLVGIKNCDIQSLKIQDFVFSQTEPKDPFYVKKREETTIISCDCNKLWDSCFCVALDINPYPEKGFDLNLTKYGEDFIVEVGSDKGRKLVDNNKSLFSQADESKAKRRTTARESFKNSLKSQVREKETPQRDAILGSVKKSYNDEKLWEHFASTCIECGGCNHCCPTCHCFFLSDERKGDLKAATNHGMLVFIAGLPWLPEERIREATSTRDCATGSIRSSSSSRTS